MSLYVIMSAYVGRALLADRKILEKKQAISHLTKEVTLAGLLPSIFSLDYLELL